MDNPFFSVVIPTYNCAELLRRALLSVQAQTLQDLEVLVVDNHSTDHTHEVVLSFNDPRIKSLKIQNNGIIAASRNLGIKTAKGQWVAFLDSDDVWHPEKLRKVKNAIDVSPEAILVCHNEYAVTNGVPGKLLRYGPYVEKMYERLLFSGNTLSTSATTIRKDILLKTNGFSEEEAFVTVEDYEYWLRLAREGHFLFIEEPLGEFHIHDNNQSSRAETHAKALVAVVSSHLEALAPNEYSRSKIRKRHAETWIAGGRLLLQSREFHLAREFCLRGISQYPFSWKGWAVLSLSILKIRK